MQNALEEILNSAGSACLTRNFQGENNWVLATSDSDKSIVRYAGELKNFNLQEKPAAGFFSYSLRHVFEKLNSGKGPLLTFPDVHCFFADQVRYYSNLPEPGTASFDVPTRPLVDKEEYLATCLQLLSHIKRGDIYEVNYCIPFVAEDVSLNAFSLFLHLFHRSPMPFSTYFKAGDCHIISASPERFIMKKGNRLLSQPMKGTLRKNPREAEWESMKKLANDPKERAENIMITDLVRNDLSRIATRGSVQVDELCKVNSLPNIYQMISTVSCEIKEGKSFYDLMKSLFPMGSMTGAPKIRAMNLIAESECFSRGPFSGSIGWFPGNGDFDMNVLIRSVFYNSTEKKLFFAAGSALTSQCDPEKEYEECLTKAAVINSLLNGR